MGTLLSGCMASSAIDSSGERLLMEGLDISTFTAMGIANYEHSSKEPSQIVGKVIYAKKLFSQADCENENQLYFWNLSKVPMLYGIVELFDDVGHQGAMDVAAMAKYGEQQFEKNLIDFKTVYPIVGWSIEGSTLNKEADGTITDSLAKKVSVTVQPCSKLCWARVYTQTIEKSDRKQKQSRVQEILKNLLKSEEMTVEQSNLINFDLEEMAKSEEMQKADFGTTSSGKPIPHHWDSAHIANHSFSAQDHKDASNAHYDAAMGTSNPQMKAHHLKMTKMHMAASNSSPWSSKRVAPTSQVSAPKMSSQATTPAPKYVQPSTGASYVNIPGKGRGMEKTMTAGGGNGQPSTKTQGEALQKSKTEIIGKTSSGKIIYDDFHHPAHKTFTAKDHREAANLYADKIWPKHIFPNGKPDHHSDDFTVNELHSMNASIDRINRRKHEDAMKIKHREEKALQKSEQTIDQAIPTWEKVEAFKKWISSTIPDLSSKEAKAFARAFKVFQIKKAEKNLKDL